MELSVVEELVAGTSLEARHLEQQLREIGQWLFIFAEQHHGGARDMAPLDEQSQPTQDLQRLARAGIVDAAAADRFLQRQHHLAMIEPGSIPARGRPILPAFDGMHLLQQQPLVGLTRHRPRGVQHPLIADAAKGHRHPRAARDGQHQHFAPRINRHPFHRGEQRRLEALEFLRQLLQRAVGDALADQLAGWGHTQQQPPAASVRKGAERAAGTGLLGGGLLELQRLGLAGGDEGGKHISGHGSTSS